MVVARDPEALERERARLSEIAARPGRLRRWRAFWSLSGPGWVQSALTLGAGSAGSSIFAGAVYGYDLLWVQPVAMFLGVVMFAAIGHQTLVTQARPYDVFRKALHPALAFAWGAVVLVASIIWQFPQYALATSVGRDILAVAGVDMPRLPIALALLVDTSASMENRLPIAQEAAIGFARRLRAQDLAEVIDFDSRVIVLQGFTNKAAELEAAIRKTSAGGSTSMYNAIYIALKDLKKAVATNTDEIRRQAIVVLSDGEDTSSLLPFEEVLDLAKRSETAIYAIGLRSSESTSSGAKGFKEAEFVLRQLAQETGGRAFFPTQVTDLNAIYGQIADELSSQYTVGYTSKNPKRDGAWRRVVVRVSRPGATSRTKLGYFAPTH